MKRKNDGQVLGRFLDRFFCPSSEQVESARDRVLQRLEREGEGALEDEVADSILNRSLKEPILDSVPAFSFGRRRIRMASALVAALLAVVIGATIVWRQNAPAVVESVDGRLYRVVEGKSRSLRVGERMEMGETIRSNGGSGATFLLSDGSRVEMRPQSELSLERGNAGVRIRLNRGGVIVDAARQNPGQHLYVQTKDVTVSVVGTVFLVNAVKEGSRVAVLEGEVEVQQGTTLKKLLAGEQVATNPLMVPLPVNEEIVWSRQAQVHLALLQQAAAPTPSQRPPVEREAFEVVSVRPAISSGGGGRGNAGSPCAGLIQLDPARFVANNATLYSLIGWAYGKNCLVESEFLSGGPGWVRSDRFNVEARLPEGSPSYTPAQLRSGNAPKLQMMLQTMLADRFRLVLRGEMKEMPVFVLTAPQGASKLSAWGDGDGEGLSITGRTNQNGERYAQLQGRKVSMARLADALGLSPAAGRLVLDWTGITGEFNIEIRFAPPNQGFAATVERETGAPANFISGPSLFTALEEKLGLELEEARASVEVWVIERVEKPLEN